MKLDIPEISHLYVNTMAVTTQEFVREIYLNTKGNIRKPNHINVLTVILLQNGLGIYRAIC
jgi:hypothetical protein